MAIEKGQEWGHTGSLDADTYVASTDALAAAQLSHVGAIGLSGGDLHRTLGGRDRFSVTGTKQMLPIDVISVELDDGTTHHAVAHVIAGRLHLSGFVVAVMNAAFVADLNLAPRAHPGDGKFDVVTLSLSLGDRLKARTRMRTGTHVPHPDIKIQRKVEGFVELPSSKPVRVDGELVGRSRTLRFTLLPAALTVAV